MSEIVKDEEIITEAFFMVRKSGNMYTKNSIEYQVLKLTNEAKCIFVELEIKETKTKQKKDAHDYFVVATGTKQKLLLLKYMLGAWLQGVMFIPELKNE